MRFLGAKEGVPCTGREHSQSAELEEGPCAGDGAGLAHGRTECRGHGCVPRVLGSPAVF